MEIEKRIYPAYAFTENEREKSILMIMTLS